MAATTELILYPSHDFQVASTDTGLYCVAEALDSTGAVSTDAVSYSSSNPSVATIDAVTGAITAVAAGTTTITATAGSVSKTRDLAVWMPVAGVPRPSLVDDAIWAAWLAAIPDTNVGTQIDVDADYAGNLQNAINAAALAATGSTNHYVLWLTEGVNYGPTTLPDRQSGTSWITLVSKGSIPAIGTRMTEARAATYNLPKIYTTGSSNLGAIARDSASANRCRNYRFIALDVGYDPAATYKIAGYAAIDLQGNSAKRLSRHARDILIDRCYVRGSPGKYNMRFGLGLEGAWIYARDCDATEFHYDASDPGGYGGAQIAGQTDTNYDSVAIRCSFAPGPVRAVNCGANSAHECVAMGGTDGPTVPSTSIGSPTVTASAGALTFSASMAGKLAPGMQLKVGTTLYDILTFNGTTSATATAVVDFTGTTGQGASETVATGSPTFAASAFTIYPLAHVLIRDVKYERCYLNRPTSWRGVYTCKNLFEMKQGLFVELEDCVYSHAWVDNQNGPFATVWSANQSGWAPWMKASDIWIHGGVALETARGVAITDSYPGGSGHAGSTISAGCDRVTVENVALIGFDSSNTSHPMTNAHQGSVFPITVAKPTSLGGRAMTGITIRHVTAFTPTGTSHFPGPFELPQLSDGWTFNDFVVEDNIFGGSGTLQVLHSPLESNKVLWDGVKGTNSRWRNNVIMDPLNGTLPGGTASDTNNTKLTSLGTQLITTPAKSFDPTATLADLAVPAGSPYKGTNNGGSYATSDGADPGADITALSAFYDDVIAGNNTGTSLADHLAITTEPSASTLSGVAHAVQPAGVVQDASDATVTDDTSTVTATWVSETGTGTAGGTLTAVCVAGVWAFTNLSVTSTLGCTGHWHFTDGALTAVDSATITITAIPAVIPTRLRGHRYYCHV